MRKSHRRRVDSLYENFQTAGFLEEEGSLRSAEEKYRAGVSIDLFEPEELQALATWEIRHRGHPQMRNWESVRRLVVIHRDFALDFGGSEELAMEVDRKFNPERDLSSEQFRTYCIISQHLRPLGDPTRCDLGKILFDLRFSVDPNSTYRVEPEPYILSSLPPEAWADLEQVSELAPKAWPGFSKRMGVSPETLELYFQSASDGPPDRVLKWQARPWLRSVRRNGNG